MNFRFFIAALWVFTSSLLTALNAQSQWHSASGPFTGEVFNLDKNGAALNAFTLGSAWISNDSGKSWQADKRFPSGVDQFVSTPKNLYILKWLSVLESRDNGIRWDTIFHTDISDYTVPNGYSRSIAVLDNWFYLHTSKTLFRKQEDSETLNELYHISSNKEFLGHFFISGDQMFMTDNYRVLRSENMGMTWDTVLSIAPTDNYFGPIDYATAVGQAVYVVADGQLIRSSDQGMTWDSTSADIFKYQSRPLLAGNEHVLIYHSDGVSFPGAVFYISYDQGATWAPAFLPYKNKYMPPEDLLWLDSFLLFSTRTGIYKADPATMLVTASQEGLLAARIHSLNVVKGVRFASTNIGVMINKHAEQDWKRLKVDSDNWYDWENVFYASGQHLIFKDYWTTYYSADGGDHWSTIAFDNYPSCALDQFASETEGLWVKSPRFDHFYFRSNQGGGFKQIKMPIDEDTEIYTGRGFNGKFYVVNSSDIIYYTSDEGKTWNKFPVPACNSGNNYYYNIALDLGNKVLVTACGEYWEYDFTTKKYRKVTLIDTETGKSFFPTFMTIEKGVLFAGVPGKGLYFSIDGTPDYWTPFSPQCPVKNLSCLLADGEKLMVGSYYNGIWEIDFPKVSIKPDIFSIQTFPNPSGPAFQLKSSVFLLEETQVDLYSSLGYLVHSTKLSAGQQWSFHLPQLPVGAYHVILRTQTASASCSWIKQ